MLITSDTPGANDSGNGSSGNGTAPSGAPSNSTSSQQEGECKDVPAPGSYSCQQQKGECGAEAGVGGPAGGQRPQWHLHGGSGWAALSHSPHCVDTPSALLPTSPPLCLQTGASATRAGSSPTAVKPGEACTLQHCWVGTVGHRKSDVAWPPLSN